ncbi:hypothetical protein KE480_14490 [Enterococcus sp. 079]|nr:hypothetical protein [Enterococcus sp. 079]
MPIVSSLAAIIIGSFFYLIWPPIQNGLVVAGEQIAQMGSLGTFYMVFIAFNRCCWTTPHHLPFVLVYIFRWY